MEYSTRFTSYSGEQMHAALEINISNYACAIVRKDEIVRSLTQPRG
jgi:hypothetical protein